MCDIIDSNFIGESDSAGLPLPFKPGQIPKMKNESFESSLDPIKLEGNLGSAEDEWKFRQIIHRGYLIAKGCRVAAVLAKKQQSVQRDCFELGKHLYLTWQAYVDLQTFKSGIFQAGEKLNLTSAPILFHLQFDPSLHTSIINQSKTHEGVDYQTVYNEVVNGPGLKETKVMLNKLRKNTRKYLANFEASEEKDKIESILSDFN
jgi:decaprenyl-diphosphate synthase subunit 2